MAQRHQRGWLKKEKRSQGETWMLFFRTLREIRRQVSREQASDWPRQRLPEQKLCMGGSRKAASAYQQGELSGTCDVCGSSAALL